MQLTFREMAPGDRAELEGMVLALYAEDPSAEGMTVEKVRGTMKQLDAHPDRGRFVVFSVDASVAGYAITIDYWSNEYGGLLIAIDELYVKPAYRGRGIATRFIGFLAASDEIEGLFLEVTPRNEHAMEMYRRLGFSPPKNAQLFRRL